MSNPTGKGGFKKGQSGNPGGRPKQLADVVEACRAEWEANHRELVAIRNNKGSSNLDKMRAIEMIENRGWGKPIQQTVNAVVNEDDARFKEILRMTNGDYRKLPSGEDGGGEDDKE